MPDKPAKVTRHSERVNLTLPPETREQIEDIQRRRPDLWSVSAVVREAVREMHERQR